MSFFPFELRGRLPLPDGLDELERQELLKSLADAIEDCNPGSLQVSGTTITFEGRLLGRLARWRLPPWKPGFPFILGFWPAPEGGRVYLSAGPDGSHCLRYSLRYVVRLVESGLLAAFFGWVLAGVSGGTWRVALVAFLVFWSVAAVLDALFLRMRFHDFLDDAVWQWEAGGEGR